MTIDLDYWERHLVAVCIDRYIADLRQACQEDQGTPDGEPNTVGHRMQADLNALRLKVATDGRVSA